MSEQQLQIQKQGNYNNITFKSMASKGLTGLDAGNYAIIKKTFVGGKPYTTYFKDGKKVNKDDAGAKASISYMCGGEYEGVKVSFWLTEKEHSLFEKCGGVDDKVKITLTEEKWVDKKGTKRLSDVLHFELVEE